MINYIILFKFHENILVLWGGGIFFGKISFICDFVIHVHKCVFPDIFSLIFLNQKLNFKSSKFYDIGVTIEFRISLANF